MVQAVVQTTVVALQGSPVSATAPITGQSLTWSGSTWVGGGPFLPLTGGTVTGTLEVNSPLLYRDTSTGIAAGGLWRILPSGGNFIIQNNTAAAGDFSTAGTIAQVNTGGAWNVPGPLTITSGGYAIQLPNGAINAGAQIVSSAGGYAFQAPNGGMSTGGNLAIGGTASIGSAGITYPGTGQSHYHAFAWTGFVAVFVDGGNIGNMQIASSDASLKQNFAALTVDPLATLDKLRLQQFDWLPETLGSQTYQKPHWTCGFSAQDLEPLIPEAVTPAVAGGPLGVDMLPLLGYLIGAVQQLSARVGALDGKAA